MAYKYDFDREACWYKEDCKKYGKVDCNSVCERYIEMHYLLNTSNLPNITKYLRGLVPEDVDIPAFEELDGIRSEIVRFVEQGYNLYIYGKENGNGKTSWALKLLLRYFDEVWAGNAFKDRGLFIYTPQLLELIMEDIKSPSAQLAELRRKIATVDLVIWDDIGTGFLTGYEYKKLIVWLESRRLAGKANIYTGNLDRDGLYDNLEGKLANRLWDDSIKVEFLGTGRRGEW